MKRKSGFVLRQVCGEYVIVGEGLERVNFNKMISLNATAAYLWDAVESKEFSVQTLTDMLLDKYDVDEKTAAQDAAATVSRLLSKYESITATTKPIAAEVNEEVE